MMFFIKLLILVQIFSSTAMGDESCDLTLLGSEHGLAITELVKGYQALEKAEVEDQSQAARSLILKVLDKRKAELVATLGNEEFAKIFESIKNKLFKSDDIVQKNVRQRRQQVIDEESQLLTQWVEGKPIIGNGSKIFAVKFSPDGKLILTAGDEGDGRVQILNAVTGELINTLTKNIFYDNSFVFSADSRYVIGIRKTGSITVWDANKGLEIDQPPASLKPDPLQSEQMSPDGKTILRYDGSQGQVLLQNLATGKEMGLENSHDVKSLRKSKFSPDGSRFVATYQDAEAIVLTGMWNAVTGAFISWIDPHSNTDISFSDDGRLVFVVAGNKINIFDTSDGKSVKEIEYTRDGKNIVFSSVQMTPDKKSIVLSASSSSQTSVMFFDFKNESIRDQLIPDRQSNLQSVTKAILNRKGDQIATTLEDGSTVIWNLKPHSQLNEEVD